MKKQITADNFTRVNNDVNGNPRYVIHFLDLLTEQEQSQFNNLPFGGIREKKDFAVQKAKQSGGKRYRGKDFGGGIVFQSYNLTRLVNQINELL